MAASIRRPAGEVGVGGGVPEWVREEGLHLLEVLALAGFALVQPVLDPVGRSPETFVARHVGSSSIVVFALAVASLPALLLWLPTAVCRRIGRRAGARAQAAVVGFLAAVAILQLLVHATDWRRRVVLVLAGGSGLAAGWARSRLAWFRAWLRLAAPAPVVFAALFLFVSPVSELLAPGSAGAGGGGGGGGAPTSLVLVVFDELSLTSILDGNGGIDRELFPNLATFADDATWYRNTTTASALTAESVPSILTGKLPREGGPRATFAGHSENVFTLLEDSHVVNAHEWVTALCPPDVCDGNDGRAAGPGDLSRLALGVWWDATWPASEPEPIDLTAESLLAERSRRERFEDFLDSLDVYARPSLDVIHVALPHSEWTLLPSGQRYTAPGLSDSLLTVGWASQDRADASRARYLLQMQYTDALVGRLVARLKETGRYDDDLVIVTADHGVVFGGSHWHRELGDDTQADIGWVPLLVKAPHQREGVVNDDNVLLVDVLPTIARELGMTIPWEIDGVPAGARTDDEKPVVDNIHTTLSNLDDGVGRLDPSVFDDVVASGPSGMGTGPLRAWRSGRHGELVGRRVSELPSGPPADVEITLDVPAGFADFDPSAPELDLFVGGRIAPARSADVVLAVDGVVAGWSETWARLGRPDEFGVLVAAPLLDAGRNEVDAYLVEQAGDRSVLRPVAAVDRS